MSTLEIAFESGRSLDTIKRQRSAAIRKLGASNMPHAIALGFREGILE